MSASRPLLRPLFSGILVAVLLVLVMVGITIDFRYVLLVGILFFGSAGYLNTRLADQAFLVALLITAPFAVLFAFLVLPELPRLFYFIPLYGLASWLGTRYSTHRRQVLWSALVLLVLAAGLAQYKVPTDIAGSLAQTKRDPLPAFTLVDMQGDSLENADLAGKVVLLDFFGTWCAPCRLELDQLTEVRAAFAERDDVVFLVVNADLGGDTPEKFRVFLERTNYPFRYAYDHEHRLFDAVTEPGTGLPTILLIDRRQNVRWQHVGFNAAETHFARDLTRRIDALLPE